MRQRLSLVVVLALVLLAFGAEQRAQAAANVTVTDCTNAGVTNAIAAVDAGGTISFNCAGMAPVIIISEKSLAKNMTIDGSNGGRGLVLSGGNTNRLFTIQAGVSITLRNLTLTNGQATGDVNGGGILNYGTLLVNGGTILNSKAQPGIGVGGGLMNKPGSNATLINSLLQGNSTTYGGGGIYNYSTMTLINSVVNANTVDGSAVNGSVGGAGIFNIGVLTMTASTVSNNQLLAKIAGHGAGIYHHGGTLYAYASRIGGNYMTMPTNGCWRGGGIFNNGGTMVLDNSLIDGNRLNEFLSNGFGGGIYNNATLTITASSILANRGTYSSGIFNAAGANLYLGRSTVAYQNASIGQQPSTGNGIQNDGTLTIDSSTISTNYTGISNSIQYPSGDACHPTNYSGTITIQNSTIAGNSYYALGANGTGATQYTLKNTIVADTRNPFSPLTCAPTNRFRSLGYNLENSNACNLTQASDKVNTDPKLEPLANNGGPTLTQALLPDSPAINAGACVPGSPPTDQRGGARIVGVACDIGAFEFGAMLPRSIAPLALRQYSGGW